MLVALKGVAVKRDCTKAKLKALPDDPLDTLIHIKDHITALATCLEPYAELLRKRGEQTADLGKLDTNGT